ncbi:MAG: hypothetical protein QOH68_2101 [Nocardioidaceae bacterium]|jgi:hypothetical protein|nr:hypothetical protein [Nocardioidaceae bacterium]
MATTKRTRPLSVADLEPAPPETATSDDDAIEIAHVTPVVARVSQEERHQRFADGIRGLRVGGGTLKLNERILMVLAGVIAPLGLILVILGWYGAAHTPYLFEQVPYLISGGLLGIGLLFLGSFFYFAHWITELVKEHRAQSSAIVEALQRLQDEIGFQAGAGRAAAISSNGSDSAAAPTAPLVATSRGSMAHRPECTIVVGKPDLRAVTADDGLVPCKLCDPYGEAD